MWTGNRRSPSAASTRSTSSSWAPCWRPRPRGPTEARACRGFGQASGAIRIQSIRAHVALRGVLYDVATGGIISNPSATATHSDKHFSGTAYTNFGAWNAGNNGSFLDSPLGKALQKAVSDLGRKVAVATERR